MLATVLGLLAVPVRPANAFTVMVGAFTATATLNDGIGNACLDNLPCPPQPTVVGDLPLHGDIVNPNFHIAWDPQHNPRTIAVQSNVCVDIGFNVEKPGKAPTHEGLCRFGTVNIGKPGTNTVTGYCESTGGQLVLALIDALGQTYFVDLHFDTLATTLVFTGHWYKDDYHFPTQRGKVVGAGEAVPPPLGDPEESCFEKTVRNLQLAGVFMLVTTVQL